MKTVLVLGDSGLVGKAIIKFLMDDYKVVGVSRREILNEGWHHLKYDLESDQLLPILENTQPEIIISCIRGDFDKQLLAHQEIVTYASNTQTKVYFFSTANVFDGAPDSVKTENHEVNASSEYGQFKVKCEKLLMDGLGEQVIILRLPMVFGQDAPRVKEIIEAEQNAKHIELYDNLIFTTIWDTQIAHMLKHIMESDLKGIFHLTSKEVIHHINFYDKFLDKNASKEVGKIKHHMDYYLALGTDRKELLDFEYSNEEVARKIKSVVKKLK